MRLEPGPPGTRVPGQHMAPFTVVKRALQVDDRAYFDCISSERITSVKRYKSLPSNAGSSLRFRLNEHCYLKFVLLGGSTLNKLGHSPLYRKNTYVYKIL